MGQLKLYNDRMADRYEAQRAAMAPQRANDSAEVSWRHAHAQDAAQGSVEIIRGH